MRRTWLAVVAGCSMAVYGCVGTQVKTGDSPDRKETRISGRYLHELTPEIYLELKDDGTYCHKFGKRNTCGTYQVDGDRAILSAEKPYELRIEGNSLVGKEGDKYTKQ